jgi:hypothetical protein
VVPVPADFAVAAAGTADSQQRWIGVQVEVGAGQREQLAKPRPRGGQHQHRGNAAASPRHVRYLGRGQQPTVATAETLPTSPRDVYVA